jgi:hypothetical protein
MIHLLCHSAKAPSKNHRAVSHIPRELVIQENFKIPLTFHSRHSKDISSQEGQQIDRTLLWHRSCASKLHWA